jgi:hypothetical protein
MKQYPVGLSWKTKGYHCEILSTEMRSDGSSTWLSHNVEWKPKWDYAMKHIKQMSTKKLEKEFKRLGIQPKPEEQEHFDDAMFEV